MPSVNALVHASRQLGKGLAAPWLAGSGLLRIFTSGHGRPVLLTSPKAMPRRIES